MTREDFENTLRDLLHREPFEPFVIELSDGQQWQIERPALAINNGGAGFLSEVHGLVDIRCQQVRQITPGCLKGSAA